MLEAQAVRKPILSREELRKLVASSVIVAVTPICCQLLLFAPINGYDWALINQCTTIGTGILLLFGLATILSSLLEFLTRKSRYELSRVLLISLCVVVSVVIGLKGRSFIRMQQFALVTVRSQPLIAAIALYDKHNGRAPTKLELLVPKYIDQIPHTGLRAYPVYEYVSPVTFLDLEAPWGLSVNCPAAVGGNDALYYLPTEKYPEDTLRGYFEPIKNWIYFHDLS